MNQIGELLRSFRERLAENGVEAARHEAALLIGARCGFSLAQIYSHPEWSVSEDQAAQLRSDLDRRLAHEPMAYILGSTEFYGLTFSTGPGVLIPRADTERLVEIALDALNANFSDRPLLRILDTCAGTGCVGISIAHHLRARKRPFRLTLVEKDHLAAGFARDNLHRHGLESVASVVEADLWPNADSGHLPDHDPQKKYDLIIANPPYIESKVIPTLMPDVACYEPQLALDGGEDGLDLYRRLIADAPFLLATPGLLLLEHGYDQAEAVGILLEKSGFADRIHIYDFGGQPRVSGGWWR